MTDRGLLDLMINRLSFLSPKEKMHFCEKFSNEEEFIKISKADAEAVIGRRILGILNTSSLKQAVSLDVHNARLRGIKWVCWNSPEYPPLLREIYDPPVVLFYRGSLPNPEKPLAAIVGTRKPSPLAMAQTYDISKNLGRSGISVISGLAIGIDAMAHRGCVESGSPSFAVLGSGVDEVYPSSNRSLANKILETGGALISEYPPGMGPRKHHFPARNRIISGLARGVLIAEAPKKSGALITAGFALEHNRELWVASSGITDNGKFDRTGTKKLSEEGAQIINSAEEIFAAWNMDNTGSLPVQDNNLASSLACSLGITL